MGRNKIKIEKIENDRNRTATFTKRKHGLIKKAMELSILCDCEIALIVIEGKKVYQYGSDGLDNILKRFADSTEIPSENVSNEDYENFEKVVKRKKEDKTPTKRSNNGSDLDMVKKKIYKKIKANNKDKPTYVPDYCGSYDETFTGPVDIKQEYNYIEDDQYFIPVDPPEWDPMLYPNSPAIPDPPIIYGNYNRNILQTNWTRDQEIINVRKRFPAEDEVDNENYYLSKFTLPSDSQPAMNWVSPHLDLAFHKYVPKVSY